MDLPGTGLLGRSIQPGDEATAAELCVSVCRKGCFLRRREQYSLSEGHAEIGGVPDCFVQRPGSVESVTNIKFVIKRPQVKIYRRIFEAPVLLDIATGMALCQTENRI
jgi:hypothetical protein